MLFGVSGFWLETGKPKAAGRSENLEARMDSNRFFGSEILL